MKRLLVCLLRRSGFNFRPMALSGWLRARSTCSTLQTCLYGIKNVIRRIMARPVDGTDNTP